ncbi:hypothetical protein C5C46_02685 [Rathayibacter sp. AY1E6]|nr:hypothetical protein C5C46_02685 [Rathayibacter sp. AY1E6]
MLRVSIATVGAGTGTGRRAGSEALLPVRNDSRTSMTGRRTIHRRTDSARRAQMERILSILCRLRVTVEVNFANRIIGPTGREE